MSAPLDAHRLAAQLLTGADLWGLFIEALRAGDRVRAGEALEAIATGKPLPSRPPQLLRPPVEWRRVLGFEAEALPTEIAVRKAYWKRALLAHPDVGGSDRAMAELNTARDAALNAAAEAAVAKKESSQ